jgi:hypothetical protein
MHKKINLKMVEIVDLEDLSIDSINECIEEEDYGEGRRNISDWVLTSIYWILF